MGVLYDLCRKEDMNTNNQNELITQCFSHLCVFNLENELLIQRRKEEGESRNRRWNMTIIISAEVEEPRINKIQRHVYQQLGIELLPGIKFDRQIRESDNIKNYYAVKQDMRVNEKTLTHKQWAEMRFVSYEEALQMMRDQEFTNQDEILLKHLFDFGKSL